MEKGLEIFSRVQYGIALLTALWLLVNWLQPKFARWRDSLAAKAAAAKASMIAQASMSVTPGVSPLQGAKLD